MFDGAVAGPGGEDAVDVGDEHVEFVAIGTAAGYAVAFFPEDGGCPPGDFVFDGIGERFFGIAVFDFSLDGATVGPVDAVL